MRFDLRHVLATMAIVFALVALVGWCGRPPNARGLDAKSTDFSASRAIETIRDLTAMGPHPLDDPERASHAHAREVVMDRLRALGLEPEVHDAYYGEGTPPLRNVVARIEGTEGAPALMLAAHYDSVSRGPGASDDGAGTATVIEIARALLASGRPRRSVVILIDDGEEDGLLGARAFVDIDPWARDVRVVLNFEARGTGGPTAMFETSEGAAWLVDVYGRSVDRPAASSIIYALYKSLPNDTDLTVFKSAGFQGLNFAFADRVWNYHTANDDLAHLDARSVQHMGDQGLAVARALVNDSLDERADGEEVYFELFSRALVRWRASLVWPLQIVALTCVALAAAIALRRRRVSLARVGVGFGVALVALLAAWAAPALVVVVVDLSRGRFPRAIDPPMAAWIALVSAAVASTSIALFALRRDDDDAIAFWLGTLVFAALIATLIAAKLPAGSYLFTLPVLFGACFLGISSSLRVDRSWAQWACAALSFVVAAVLWMPFARVLLVMIGAGVPPMTTIPIGMLVLFAAPLVVAPRGRARAIVPVCAGVVSLVAALLVR